MNNLTINFTIGSTAGSLVAGSFEEFADISATLSEISRAVDKIAHASGVPADQVNIVYRKDLQTQDGRKFNKATLRAYNNGKSYSIDFGTTDKNPLGVYVKSSAEVEEYSLGQRSEQAQQVAPAPAPYPQPQPQQQQNGYAPAPNGGYPPAPNGGYQPNPGFAPAPGAPAFAFNPNQAPQPAQAGR